MYSTTGAGAAYTAGAGAMPSITSACAAYTAGASAMHSTTGACATYTTGEGAGAAYTAEAGASYRRQALGQHKTPLVPARCAQRWAESRHKTQERLDNGSMCGVHCGCRQCRNTGAGATQDTTGAGASNRRQALVHHWSRRVVSTTGAGAT